MYNCILTPPILISIVPPPSPIYPPILLFFKIYFLYFLKDFIYLFLERGEGREKVRERNINDVQEIHGSVASCTSPTGALARDQACALTRN